MRGTSVKKLIRPVAESPTHRPITFVPSHFHYDHTGNELTFEHVAVFGALEGTGLYPIEYPVNDRVRLLAEPT